MCKRKTIVYGLGRRFNNRYFQDILFPRICEIYDVKGVCDKEKRKEYLEYKFNFIERSIKLLEYDLIIVTSDIFYNEIKNELMSDFGVPPKSIISLDEVEDNLISQAIQFDIFEKLSGVEIGGPSVVFRNIYQICKRCDGVNFSRDTVWWDDDGLGYKYNDKLLGEVIIADAVDLAVIDSEQYEFCISSNNLEHIANPMKAMTEIKRIVKRGGIILVIVPCKDMCFDHNREFTSFNHILSDYENGIDEHDLSHLDEIASLHDYTMDDGIDSMESFLERAKDNYYNRCLHQHVFSESVLLQMFNFLNIEVMDSGQVLNNYYILGRK